MQSSDEAEIEQRHRRVKHMEHGTHDTCFNHFPFSLLLFSYILVFFFYLLSAFILLTLFDCAFRKQFANCLKRRNESQIDEAGQGDKAGKSKGREGSQLRVFF